MLSYLSWVFLSLLSESHNFCCCNLINNPDHTDSKPTAMSSENEGASSEQPIIIPDDPQSSLGREVEEIVQQIQASDARLNPIELGDDTDSSSSTEDGDAWAQLEADYDREIQNIESIDLTQDDEDDKTPRKKADARCQHYDRHARNPCLCGAYDEVNEHAQENGDRLKVLEVHGLTEEVRVGRFLVDFLEINSIWVHRTKGTVVVRGLAYTRTRNLDGRVQAYQNEVCQVMQIDTNDPRPNEEQAAVEVTLDQVRPEPRVLHKTNKPFPECRFELADYRDKEDREKRAPLVCRWQHTMQYPDRRYRRAQRPVDGEVLRHFVEEDVKKKRHRASDIERLNTWRRCAKIRGGSYVPNKDDIARATEGIVQGDSYVRMPGQTYTAADLFSGAGGVTKGAKKAGFRVLVAVDHWPRCNATYKANHPEVELHEVDIMDFCNDLTDEDDDDDERQKTPLDLIHLSPPCQTWSPAHTVMGRNDPANIAALSACQHIVHKHRPRIVTFEQTFGIVHERHLPYFNALVQSLTRYGYSLKWRVFPLVQFGLPQNRKRLLMIGSAPGEPLPAWPEPTHSEDPSPYRGQRQYVSAIKACQMLREGMNLHNVEGAKELRPHREPWDGHKPMNRTITTSGGQSYHWDGERELTLAEFARLQGFPYDYKFIGPCIKKQIGNAFPPCVVRAFMSHLRRHLEKLDRIAEEVDFICLNNDDDEDNAGHRRLIWDEHEEMSPNWWTTKDEEDWKHAPGSPKTTLRHSPDLEYFNTGLTSHEAWRAAIEESKRGDRRRSTTDSSVVVTGAKQLPIEVMDDNDDEDGDTSMPDLVPIREAGHSGLMPISSPLSGPSSTTRKNHVDPSALKLRTSSIAGPSSPSRISLPHRPAPQDDGFVNAQGRFEVFPKTPPGLYSSSPARASSSGTSNSQKAHFAPDGLSLANFEQMEETFQRNRAMQSFHMSSMWSSSVSMYQEHISEMEALDAAIKASVQQLQQQGGGICQVPVPVPELGLGLEQEEQDTISEEAAAAALKFFGPWNPRAPRVDEGDEEEHYVGKGKGKAVLREHNEGEEETAVAAFAEVVDEDGDTQMNQDAQLQRAIAMSMEGVPKPKDEETERGGGGGKREEGKGRRQPCTKRLYIFEGDEEGSPSKKGRILI